MAPYPVTIRLLDPPLHEFLPKYKEVLEEYTRLDARGFNPERHSELGAIKARLEPLLEANPMLGHRGCRLGITFPEIYDMQVRAIMEAACAVAAEGVPVEPEIMIPLTGTVAEMKLTREMTDRVARQVLAETGRKVAYSVGTMIEVPRAALIADRIARVRRVLLVRHQRPDPDDLRVQPGRHRQVPALLPREEAAAATIPSRCSTRTGWESWCGSASSGAGRRCPR